MARYGGRIHTGPWELRAGGRGQILLVWWAYGGSTVNQRVDVIGVSCYSSQDLYTWKHEGPALSTVDAKGHDFHPSMVVDRPKVVYNEFNGGYVMWMHSFPDYMAAKLGVAVSCRPEGPFEYMGSFRL